MEINHVEYNWFVMMAQKKRKKVRVWTRVPFVILFFVGIVVISSGISYLTFSGEHKLEKIHIDDLNEGWVDKHPYVKIEGACMNNSYVKTGLIFEKEKYYLLESCDYFSGSKNKVVVKTMSGLPQVDDSGKLGDYYVTGLLINDLEGKTSTRDYLRSTFDLHGNNVYMLNINETPTHKSNEDGKTFFGALGSGALLIAFCLYMRSLSKKELNDWLAYFKMKYPQINY